MTLIEATKTGKRIRRKYWTKYQGEETWWDVEMGLTDLVPEDILADDWEVETTPVSVTREQFEEAWRTTCAVSRFVKELDSVQYNAFTAVRDILIKELGL